MLALLLVLAFRAPAAPPARPAPAPVKAPVPAPVTAPEPVPVPPASPQVLLDKAQAALKDLDYDAALALASAVLAHPDTSEAERVDAFLLHATSAAVVGDPIDAEKSFRLLVRLRPDFELADDSPPKILGVFRKVQSEERAISDQVASAERRRLIDSIVIEGTAPTSAEGGRPLLLSFPVRDPHAAVVGTNLRYRKAGEASYSSLVLNRGADGAWQGTLPASFTASPAEWTLEWFVETSDARHATLAVRGSAGSPLRTTVSAGSEDVVGSGWLWVAGAGAAVLVAAVSVGAVAAVMVASVPPSDLGAVVVP